MPIQEDQERRVPDITAKLRASEEFNRSLMDATPDCVKVLDLGGKLLHMNTPGLCAMEIDDFGPVCGQAWDALWPVAAKIDIQRSVTRAVGGEASSFQAFCPTRKGTPKWWEVTVSPIRDAEGGPVVRLLAVSRDITERRQVETRLRASEAEFRAAFENSPVAKAQISAQTGRFVRLNARYCELTGYSAEELAGMMPADITYSKDRDADVQGYASMLRGDLALVDAETRYLRKDGEIIWVHATATLLRDAHGQPGMTMVVVQEITARKQADEKLRAAHDSFQSIVQNSPFGLYTTDAKLRIVQVSAGGQKAFANVPSLIGGDLGEVLRVLWPEPFPTDAVAIFRRVLETGESYHAPSLVEVRADIGALEAYDWRVDRVTLPDGQPGLVCHFYDLSERHRFEALLSQSEGRYRNLFNAMLEGYCLTEIIYDAEGVAIDYRWLEVNPAFEAQSGLKNVKGLTAREVSLDIASNWVGLFAAVAESGVPARFENFDATVGRWFDVHAYRVEDVEGKKVATFFRDITAYEATQRALRQSEERMRAATVALSNVIWTNNADGSMEDEQPGWSKFTGQTREEYQGYGWSKAIHPDDAQTTLDVWNSAVADKSTFVLEHRVRRHDGEWRLCSVRAVPLLNGKGTTREWVGVHADITERKRDEEQLRELAAELSATNHRKDAFLATLAHELRNPLAPIRNGLQLMKLAGGQTEAMEQARAMMERQLTQMVRLVDDLMDVSRISQGKLELRKERVSLATVLNSAVETSLPLIEKMDHKLTITLPEQPIMVDADTTRLAQVFLNLLNNAAKYSERSGHIQLKVELQGCDAVVSVQDTGIGIAADQLPRIFEMFTQVGASLEKAQGGLGIGLTLVKQLLEMHGGKVEASSEGPGKGSQFVVRLPVESEASQVLASGVDSEQKPSQSSLRILIVDDSRDGADSMAEMLQIMGNDTRTAYDGQQGVDTAEEYRPDVILFDIGMPKLNGYEACRLIRQQPWGKRVVLIAVTGWGQDKDRARTREAGFDHHLVKPVNPQELMTMLSGLSVDHGVG